MNKNTDLMSPAQQGCEMDEAKKKWLSGEKIVTEKGKKVVHDLRGEYDVSGTARMVVEYSLEGRLTPDLIKDIYESLRGFEENVQLQIVESLSDYVTDQWEHTTNLKTVDTLVRGLYARIKEQMDNPEKFGIDKYDE